MLVAVERLRRVAKQSEENVEHRLTQFISIYESINDNNRISEFYILFDFAPSKIDRRATPLKSEEPAKETRRAM